MPNLLDQLEVVDLPPWAIAAAVAAVAAVALWLIGKRFRRRRASAPTLRHEPLDVAQLDQSAPPSAGPSLELYNVPVRLAAVVLAPTGRGGGDDLSMPTADLLDQIVPGLKQVFLAQRPLVRRWEPQLSSQGFVAALFAHLQLPGDRGKGTPWCAVAGRAEVGGRKLLLGLVLRSAAANSLSQFVVERDSQWLDLFRVRTT